MTSINTNLSSLIVQKNLTKSTNALNQAVERLTTGFKINHASDNAANYSISESMSSKLSSYFVAEENTSMGLDLIRTQSSTLDTIQNLTTRLRALAEQAHNGSYGAQSLAAINQEADAIISEIERIGNNAEYNGIKLFDNAISQAGIPQLKSNGLMQEIEQRDTSSMTKLADVDASSPLAAGTYSISSAEELAKLAAMLRARNIASGSEFVLGADIDLSDYIHDNGWKAIGALVEFSGIFDGNGYTISNLSAGIADTTYAACGLFGKTNDAVIKNLVVKDCNIISNRINANVGCIVGYGKNTIIENCSVTGNINNENGIAGLIAGYIENDTKDSYFDSCYASGQVISKYEAGGIAGKVQGSQITMNNCFSEAVLESTNSYAGGLIGLARIGEINNSGFAGSVLSLYDAGGIIGSCDLSANNCSLNNVTVLAKSLVSIDYDGGIIVGEVLGSHNLNISGIYDSNITNNQGIYSYIDNENMLSANLMDTASKFQVGIDSTTSSAINFSTNISLTAINYLKIEKMESRNSLETIDDFLSKLSEAQTKLGAIENRLTSTIESIGVNIENLTSSRSTLKDADVAKESSQVLKNQILQQAAATLLATANQTPSLALRLLGGI